MCICLLGGLMNRDHLKVDRKSTRLNSSHSQISYAVFCLKKKKLSVAQPFRQHREPPCIRECAAYPSSIPIERTRSLDGTCRAAVRSPADTCSGSCWRDS